MAHRTHPNRITRLIAASTVAVAVFAVLTATSPTAAVASTVRASCNNTTSDDETINRIVGNYIDRTTAHGI